eukprot:Nk52_evm16s295 gene=Nk52_evmTU16s295
MNCVQLVNKSRVASSLARSSSVVSRGFVSSASRAAKKDDKPTASVTGSSNSAPSSRVPGKKSNPYEVSHYYKHSGMSYYDIEADMGQKRCPQPKSN